MNSLLENIKCSWYLMEIIWIWRCGKSPSVWFFHLSLRCKMLILSNLRPVFSFTQRAADNSHSFYRLPEIPSHLWSLFSSGLKFRTPKYIQKYICKLVFIGHSHVYFRVHEDLQKFFLGYCILFELFERSWDISKVLRILCVNVMVD